MNNRILRGKHIQKGKEEGAGEKLSRRKGILMCEGSGRFGVCIVALDWILSALAGAINIGKERVK